MVTVEWIFFFFFFLVSVLYLSTDIALSFRQRAATFASFLLGVAVVFSFFFFHLFTDRDSFHRAGSTTPIQSKFPATLEHTE